MTETASANELTSYAANCVREQARVAMQRLGGDDAKQFLQDLRQQIVEALAREPDPRAVRPDIVDRANELIFRRYGTTAFEKAQDNFDYDGRARFLWNGELIAEKSSVSGPLEVVEELSPVLAEKIARRIDARFGLSGNELASDGIMDVLRDTGRFIRVNLNASQRFALARQLGAEFERIAGDVEHDLERFLDEIYRTVRQLRRGMFVCEDGDHRPRVYGRNLVVWLDRIIAAVTPRKIEIFSDELFFFVDALNQLLGDSYNAPDKYATPEANMLKQFREQAQSGSLPISEGALEIWLALAMSTGRLIENEEDMKRVGSVVGAINSMQCSDEEKLEFAEGLALTTLRHKPRVTPFDLFFAAIEKHGLPNARSEAEQRLSIYRELVDSGAADGIDHPEQVLSLVDARLGG